MPLRSVGIYLSARAHGSREEAFLQLIRRLLDQGTRVDVLVAGAEPWLSSTLDPRARIEDVSRWWMGVGWLRLPHLLRVYFSAPAVSEYLRRANPDVLFATSIPPNLAALLGRKLAGTATPIVIRQSNVIRFAASGRYDAIRRRPRDWLLPMLYRRAERAIAVSAGVADNLRLLCPALSSRITAVPNGVALGQIEAKAAERIDHPWLQAEAKRPNHEPVLLAVGRLVKKKDYPTLLRALQIVRHTCPARLIILGDGPERGGLETLACELGIAEAVSMPGFRPNPFPYVARASAYVLSSISEGMPSALIEALACGCPAVSTDCPSGPSEVLDDGRYGALVPVGKPEALAQAILEAVRQPLDEERLRARAAEFSVEACVARYAEVLMEVGQSAKK